MYSRSKAVSFNPYGRRRSRWRLPRWLLLLLLGLALGAGGVLFAQERYLPPRLSVEASEQLRSALQQADTERARLAGELGQASTQLAAALGDKKLRLEELAAGRTMLERLRLDLASAVDSLPPDPRKSVVEVRAARFAAKSGALAYDVVLTRESAAGKSLPGLMQLVVTGESVRHSASSVSSKPMALSLGRQEILRGELALPEGFRPQQTVIRILGQAAGELLGTRTFVVR